MKVSDSKAMALFVSLAIVLITVLAISFDSIKENTERLKVKTRRINIFDDNNTLNPHADIKLFILKKYPGLYTEVHSMKSPQKFSELKKEIYNEYILENHKGIIESLNGYEFDSYEDARGIITVLSFLYLLPAYLYEQEGFSSLAKADYGRYLLCYKKLSEKVNYFQRTDVQNRISIARLKLYSLNKTIPKLRTTYYRLSYFSWITNNFFDGISKRAFLKNYVSNGYLKPIPSAGADDDTLYQGSFVPDSLYIAFSKYRPSDVPFETYELFASHGILYDVSEDNVSKAIVSNIDTVINNTDDPFIKSLSLFKKALVVRRDKPEEACSLFLACSNIRHQDIEFIRDDAMLFYVLLKYANDPDKIEKEQIDIKKSFGLMCDAHIE
jgi:hypothetical protein